MYVRVCAYLGVFVCGRVHVFVGNLSACSNKLSSHQNHHCSLSGSQNGEPGNGDSMMKALTPVNCLKSRINQYMPHSCPLLLSPLTLLMLPLSFPPSSALSLRWFVAYCSAASFRFSHYFISFLSEGISALGGLGYNHNKGQW